METWSDLPKSQIDPQTILEAIAELIQNHLDDPDAHLEAGQSLQSHKASGIIDHAALSVVNDKIANGDVDLSKLNSEELQFFTVFESIDAWYSQRANLSSVFEAVLQTSGLNNDVAYMYLEPNSLGDVNSFVKDTFFQTTVMIPEATLAKYYLLCGSLSDYNNDSGFGFTIESGSVYALTLKNVGGTRTEYKTLISGITVSDINVYKAYFDYSESKIYFYINGLLVHTQITNLPTESTDVLFVYYVKALEASTAQLNMLNLMYSRKF
jgi:hypothetical protein